MLYVNFHVMKRLSDEMLLEQNLELSWYEVLLHVGEAKGPITQRDLQELVMLGQSGLSRVLTRMEAAELIRRCALENDRRTLSVELTQIGRERLSRAARVHLAGIKRWFGDQLTTEESDTIGAALQNVSEQPGRRLPSLVRAGVRHALAPHSVSGVSGRRRTRRSGQSGIAGAL